MSGYQNCLLGSVSGVCAAIENVYVVGSGTYGHAGGVAQRRSERSETEGSEAYLYPSMLKQPYLSLGREFTVVKI